MQQNQASRTPTFDLVIKNGMICSFGEQGFIQQQGSIGIRNGLIENISSSPLSGNRELDARHCHILPGVIDSQVHFREPGLTHKEDIESGSRAAVMGGVTSFFEMPNTSPPTTSPLALQDKLERARGRSWANYAFFVGASPENISQLGDLELLPHAPGIKVFMGSSTGTLLVSEEDQLQRVLQSGRRRVIVHAEDEDRLRQRKLEFRNDTLGVVDHDKVRDAEVAFLATQKLIKWANVYKRPVHVLHVTTRQEMELLRQNKHIATVEVLPQHLLLSSPECYQRFGTLVQQNPPIRDRSHQEALWAALADGTVDIMASDHAPHTKEEKNLAYPKSPSGMPGVQTLVPLMCHMLSEKRISLEKMVSLVCENPRRIFGCQSKGRIEIGGDADFTIIDFKKSDTLRETWLQSKCRWSPFIDMKITGWPIATIVGGHIVMREAELLGRPLGLPVNF